VASLKEYDGRLLNHVEILYQRGERDLAIGFFEALDCRVVSTARDSGTGSTYAYALPEETEDDAVNNVFYLSEIREPQWRLERVLERRVREDEELREALEEYDTKARTKPHGTTHFGLRYRSFEDIEAVIDRLEHDLPAELAGRVAVVAIRPGDPECMSDSLIQAFVRTDVVCAGLFPFGQVIELQAQRG
jgi:hypothetical protein